MTLEQIEAFLTVTTLGNISAAANSLYVTQSTLSSRIHSLEAELNVPLFIRSRGKQKVELTNYGNAFIPLASQWMALWKNTQHLTSIADYTSLTYGEHKDIHYR